MATSRLHELTALGQSVWVDNLARQMLRGGELERLMREDAVTGITSNPTIFAKALAEGDAYDEQLAEVLEGESDPKEVFLALATRDVSDACDVLAPVWEETDGREGYVSIEVDPRMAADTGATIAEAVRLHDWIRKPNLFVKIPATQEGLPAIEEMIARGRSINVTLIFSLERYAAVAEAYLRGLERHLTSGGGDLHKIASVASFFVSRVDTEADRLIDESGAPRDLRGRLAIANAKLAYQHYKEILASERWAKLAARGARPQRCLWASTSTKDPTYRDTLYIEELIGPDTITTMPPETIEAFQDHGRVDSRLERGVDDARKLLGRLAEAGVDYDQVVQTIEEEGVQKFVASFDELIERIEEKARAVAAV
jgi:transaldolase